MLSGSQQLELYNRLYFYSVREKTEQEARHILTPKDQTLIPIYKIAKNMGDAHNAICHVVV